MSQKTEEVEEVWYNGMAPTEKGARFTHSYFGRVECKGHDHINNLTAYTSTNYLLVFGEGKLLVAFDAIYNKDIVSYKITPDAYLFTDSSGKLLACIPRQVFMLEDFPDSIEFDEFLDGW